ncbi:MAG TPA: DUF1846 domain-containing protein [Spirochaetota bacterium]|jgi:uncharacterized protein (UPF0371 family)|nr:MAG: hypothetical protein BWY23_01331 [Spirochaetes bacterium ADurb.Bin218]HOK01250.1 DUF1846 domain-containing protein [Spirochaetota bacterium]HOK91905.1 DUF1846 domain-containing protein [Spirochaetota bacterium]HON17015.1 DUF1846 domain-containing protein [Spirochaetota bacterium]HPD78426.1 DUF1846 domain-containing protein [Spirochaetota bacterium]
MNKIGFDNELYLKEQSSAILNRIKEHGFSKLYLEFGGKILFDYHAARVLPGFDPNVKMKLLERLKDSVEVLMCICAIDIEKKKLRADFGITYDADTLRTIDDFNEWGIKVRAVVITRFDGQPGAVSFMNKLQRRGVSVYTHKFTKGYPTDVDLIVSEEGYGANEYIETERPIVVVTGPGPGSGKLATCLSQLYHEHKRGIKATYAKFETFPIWNLPLQHPVNIAYEAATAELRDVNMLDHFHLDAYNQKAVNYNRDIEAFPLLKRIIERITGAPSFYKSPTDMGVNRAGFAIIDDEAVKEASKQEIIRRYFRYSCEYAMGLCDKDTVQRVELLMKDLSLTATDRKVVEPAREAANMAKEKNKGNKGIYSGAALELKDGTIITGYNSPLLHASSSVVLNAIKKLAGIPNNIDLLPGHILTSLMNFKKEILQGAPLSLDLEETLITLAISATTNPGAEAAMHKLKELAGCEIHLTHMPTPGDAAGLRKLGLNTTSDPDFASKALYIG